MIQKPQKLNKNLIDEILLAFLCNFFAAQSFHRFYLKTALATTRRCILEKNYPFALTINLFFELFISAFANPSPKNRPLEMSLLNDNSCFGTWNLLAIVVTRCADGKQWRAQHYARFLSNQTQTLPMLTKEDLRKIAK